MAADNEALDDGDILKKFIDPEDKIKEWILISTPYPVCTVLLVYFVFVLKLGPDYMKSRPPIDLHNTLRLYNLFQVLSNLFLVLRLLVDPAAIVALVKTQCSLEELNDVGKHSEHLELMLWYGWAYLILKMTDLLDTVFMVLKKKNSHITFLHVYHHTAMVFFVWLCFRHSKSHHGVIPVYINLIIHVLMYSYYFLATFPAIKERLWWKKHLTKFQLGVSLCTLRVPTPTLSVTRPAASSSSIPSANVPITVTAPKHIVPKRGQKFKMGQFVLVLVYFSFLYYNECNIPRIFTYVWMFNVSVFCVLFVNFYIKAYIRESSRTKTKSL